MKGWKLSQYTIVYIALVLVFIYVLHFVDFFNLQIFLQASSYLYMSQNPYAYFPNQFPPNYFLFLLPNFIIYLYSHNNIYASILFIKIFQMTISILTAYFIYKIISVTAKNLNRAKYAFLAYLFSPVIFWVNYFQFEQSPVGIFFTMLSLYFLIISFEKDKNHFLVTFASSLLLIYAAYLYLFPIVIIPIILTYQKSLRNFLITVLAISLSFLFISIPYFLLHGFDLIGGTAAIAMSGVGASVGFTIIGLLGPHIYPPDVFQLLLSYIFKVIFLSSIFLVPILMRILRIENMFIPILTNLSLVFLFIPILNLDEFSWLVPIAILVFSGSMQERKLLRNLMFIQVYDLPYIILFLINGSIFNLSGSGIFYLGYLQFHKNIDLDLEWWAPMVNRILILSGFIAILLLSTVSLWLWHRNLKKSQPSPYKKKICESIFTSHNFTSERLDNEESVAKIASKNDKNRSTGVLNTFFVISICVIFALSAMPMHNSGAEININEPANPVGIFVSQPIMGTSTTYKYIDGYKSLYVFPTNPTWQYGPNASFYFSRNITEENAIFNLSVQPVLSGNIQNFDYSLISISNLLVNISSVPSMPDGSFPISPFLTENAPVITSGNSTPYIPVAMPIHEFNGTSVMEYHLNRSSFINNSFGFIFHLNCASWQNQIVFLKFQNQLLQIFTPPCSNKIILAYSDGPNWNTLSTFFASQQWNAVEFRLSNDFLTVNINGNGYVQTGFSINGSDNLTLAIGKDFDYSAFNFKYAMKGDASLLFDIPNGTISYSNIYLEVSQANENFSSIFVPYIEKQIDIKKTGDNVVIETNGIQYSTNVTCALMKFGRLGISPIPVVFTFNSIRIESNQLQSYLYKYIILIYFPPVVAVAFLALYNRRQISEP